MLCYCKQLLNYYILVYGMNQNGGRPLMFTLNNVQVYLHLVKGTYIRYVPDQQTKP